MTTETILITGHGGDEVQAYVASPSDEGARGGVVVIHHMPGYDRGTKEIVRRFAELGYDAICPNLYHREAPGAAPDDAAAAARASGGVPDGRLIGDVGAAAEHLRSLPRSNGKVGVIGYCSGGRQSVLAACNLDLDAAVDCYGAFVTGTPPPDFPIPISNLVDQLLNLRAPLRACSATGTRRRIPNRWTSWTRSSPARASRTSSTATTAPATRSSPPIVPPIGWRPPTTAGSGSKPSTPRTSESWSMCTYATVKTTIEGSAKGPDSRWFHVTDGTVYFDHPVHAMAEHTLNIDFADPAKGPGARVAVELTAASARELVTAIQAALDSAPPGMTV